MSSSIRTNNIKKNTLDNGYIIVFTLNERINAGCSILELPFLQSNLIGHKVIITDGKTVTNGIVILQGYLFFMNNMPLYYTAGAKLYILTEKYNIYVLRDIYTQYREKLKNVTKFIRESKGATLDIAISFDADYATSAGTTELNDILETKVITALSNSLNISPNRLVIKSIRPGSVIIDFSILESLDVNEPSPVFVGEELKFQLSMRDSKLFKDDFINTAKSLYVSVNKKNMSITDPEYTFLRDYNVNI